ncbi:MAG: hypothetical protein V3T05_05055, partial [Myxococcota bacterium]
LAARGMAEWLFGDIPFYEMVHWGGMQPIAGFGGADTIRGISFGRWRAPGKAVANLEARFDIGSTDFRGDRLQGLVVPYLDAGIVFGAGSLGTALDADVLVHPAAGLSLRAIYAEGFVGRIDSGIGLDPVRAASGRLRNELSWGMYVVFDHPF